MKKKNFNLLVATLTIAAMLLQPLTVFGQGSPQPPTLQEGAMTATSIEITWNNIGNQYAYTISSTASLEPIIKPKQSTSHSFDELTPNTTYFFQIKAHTGNDGGGQGTDFSDPISVTTLPDPDNGDNGVNTISVTGTVEGPEIDTSSSVNVPETCTIDVYTTTDNNGPTITPRDFSDFAVACGLQALVSSHTELQPLILASFGGDEVGIAQIGTVEASNVDFWLVYFAGDENEPVSLNASLFEEESFTVKFVQGTPSTPDARTIDLRIEGSDAQILHQNVAVPYSCEVTESDSLGSISTSTYSDYPVVCALDALNKNISYIALLGGELKIGNIPGHGDNVWFVLVNNKEEVNPIIGDISEVLLEEGDNVLVYYNSSVLSLTPLRISADKDTYMIGTDDNISVTIESWADEDFADFTSTSTLSVNGTEFECMGTPCDIPTASLTPGTVSIVGEAEGHVRSSIVHVELQAPARNVTLSVLFNEEENGMDIEEQNVHLPYSCAITDHEGTEHNFTDYKAICVLEAISEARYEYTVHNNISWGLFLESIEGVGGSESGGFWAVYHNEGFAMEGLSDLELLENDSLTLEFTLFNGEDPTPPPPVGGGGGGSSAHIFSVRNAVQYIVSFFTSNGSVHDNVMLSDWSAVAFGAAGSDVTTEERETLRAYLLTDPDPITGPNHTTSYARRAMALMSLNIDPFNGTDTNYIEKIVDMFDGTQFKDTPTGGDAFLNDDIFALVVLHRAGFTVADDIITKTVAYIVSQQVANGSIGGSADLTAAAIQALQPFNTLEGVSDAIEQALAYLKNTQTATGGAGFGDIPVTSWSLQALGAVGQATNPHWNAPSGSTPQMYLSENQSTTDGGMIGSDVMTRIWNTTYAIPGYLALPWDSILLAWNASGTVVTNGQTGSGTTTDDTSTSDDDTTTDDTTSDDTTTTDEGTTTPTETTPPTTGTGGPVTAPPATTGGTTILPVGEVLGERIEDEEETTTVETIDRGVVAGDQDAITTTTDGEEDTSWVRRLFVGSLVAALILIIYLAYISRKRDERQQ